MPREHELAERGARIRRLRLAKGWKQDRLAEASGLDQGTISAYENGRRDMTPANARKLAHALDVSSEAILFGTGTSAAGEETAETDLGELARVAGRGEKMLEHTDALVRLVLRDKYPARSELRALRVFREAPPEVRQEILALDADLDFFGWVDELRSSLRRHGAKRRK